MEEKVRVGLRVATRVGQGGEEGIQGTSEYAASCVPQLPVQAFLGRAPAGQSRPFTDLKSKLTLTSTAWGV